MEHPALNYSDITLIPKYSRLISRSEADTSVEFCGYRFKAPIVPANMKCTINFALAEQLADNGYFYILHRFYDYKNIYEWIKENNEDYPNRLISISVGVKPLDYDLVKSIALEKAKVDFITIDVAHGESVLTERMASCIRKFLPDTKLIIGNIWGTKESINFCKYLGAKAIKVGIGPGKSCSTTYHTGFQTPMVSAIKEASNFTDNTLPIIADGGIRSPGDITKALVCGASMVMVGSMFAACKDSPAPYIRPYIQGKITKDSDCTHKMYFGSASEQNKGNKRHVEGESIAIPINNITYLEKLDQLKQDLQSSISYAGGTKLIDLRNVQYLINK